MFGSSYHTHYPCAWFILLRMSEMEVRSRPTIPHLDRRFSFSRPEPIRERRVLRPLIRGEAHPRRTDDHTRSPPSTPRVAHGRHTLRSMWWPGIQLSLVPAFLSIFDYSSILCPYSEGCNQLENLPRMLQVQLTVKHPETGEEVLRIGMLDA